MPPNMRRRRPRRRRKGTRWMAASLATVTAASSETMRLPSAARSRLYARPPRRAPCRGCCACEDGGIGVRGCVRACAEVGGRAVASRHLGRRSMATAIARGRHHGIRRRRRQPRRRRRSALAAELLNSNLKNYAGVRLRRFVKPLRPPPRRHVRRRASRRSRARWRSTAHCRAAPPFGRVRAPLLLRASATAANVPNVSDVAHVAMSPVSPVSRSVVSRVGGALHVRGNPGAHTGRCPGRATFASSRTTRSSSASTRPRSPASGPTRRRVQRARRRRAGWARLALFQPRFLDGRLLAKLRRLVA